MDEKHKLLILYASQTGNAIDAAERVAREAERRGCPVSLLSLDRFDPSFMDKEQAVIFVVSTTGQGDAPDAMKAFWRYLLKKSLSRKWLEGVNYAVFGLGDSSYQKYNFVAKKLDKRLLDLGGRPLLEKGLGDDQHPSGYEGALDPWIASLWNVLYEMDPNFFSYGVDYVISNGEFMDHPKVHITYYDTVNSPKSEDADLESMASQIHSSRSMSPGNFVPEKSTPHCWLKMIRNCTLTKADTGKDVRHFEFEYFTNVFNYEIGDVLEVLPCQSLAQVDAFIKRCNLNPEAWITVQHGEAKDEHSDYTVKTPVRLRKFVELAMDIASASPRRYFFEVMSHFAAAEHEKERLQYFASAEGRDDLYRYNQRERRSVVEVVLEDFPSVQMPFEWLVQVVPPLRTRAFSISSSPAAHPNQVHLTVNVVSWVTPLKRKRVGLCSTWLASLDPQQGVTIPVWFQKGSLSPPLPSLPLILVGPGTGCAPFRGFVAERAVQSKHGSTAPVLLFFGCHNRENDFLYSGFWQSHSGGVLSEEKGGGFYAAFSRDQPEKVYVQHKMRERGSRVWRLLRDGGAHVYVAGSSTKMPGDVMEALEDIICTEGGVGKEAAARWLRALERAGKYHVEAWS
ncbi:hypothetical protein V2J09_013396 [Rumex salicifolius]